LACSGAAYTERDNLGTLRRNGAIAGEQVGERRLIHAVVLADGAPLGEVGEHVAHAQRPEGGLDDLPRGHRSLFHARSPSPNGKCSPVTTTGARDLPVPALQVANLGVAGLVVDEVVAGRALSAGLEKGAARGVPLGFRRVGVPRSPVRQQAQRPGVLHTTPPGGIPAPRRT
jgi:hypothetical protein